MADYSFVTDQDGQILGLWIQEAELAQSPVYIVTLLKKHHGRLAAVRKPITDELLDMALSRKYRIVPNNYNRDGGCFVMFGQFLAPGEGSKPQAKPAVIPICPKCGNSGSAGDLFCRKCGSRLNQRV